MNEEGEAVGTQDQGSPLVFISYASGDRAEALKVCKAIEGRGTRCWIATRDVPPGENYQEAIVQSLRSARAVALVFSAAANTSDEIKKELSLASRYHVPVIALRVEDVAPSDAFAYELSTRQWINAFEGWDKAIDTLVGRIAQISGSGAATSKATTAAPGRKTFSSMRPLLIAAAAILAVLAAAGAWWASRSPTITAAAAHSMMIRLAGYQLLSPDLPANLPATVDAEITAAFNVDGVVGVSNAATRASGAAQTYALGGTIQRDGDKIRVITRMINELSGATLWSDTFNYDANEVARVPRRIAVEKGNVVRCGLFGASTYYKPLPDPVLRDYMQFCQAHWDPNLQEGRKALIPAQRVVAALPDFSWGWAAVAGAYWKVLLNADNSKIADDARVSGREAADRAVAIDSRNSEALYIKSMLLDRNDWIAREELFKRAIAARRLDCGCEYHQYGWLLLNVGRTAEALEHLHRADDMLALYVYTPMFLAQALVVADKPEEARHYFDAAIDLSPNAGYVQYFQTSAAISLRDANFVANAANPIPEDLRAALLKGYRAVATRDSGAKSQAVAALLALSNEQQSDAVVRLLADLGATHEAFEIAARIATKEGHTGPTLFWNPSMHGVLADPGFPALATQLGLMKYWTTTHTKPDVCDEKDPPPFCRMI